MTSLLTKDVYRHKNGLKHINIINGDGFSAIFIVNTPIFDNSGVAHGVEHMAFRRSAAFPKPETLFQLTSLTDAKINASTFSDTTCFHCQSQCSHTFILVINYLLNGIFNPVFDAEDLRCEIHDGNNKGVIYQELLGIEQAHKKVSVSNKQDDFCYGGISKSIGDLSLNDLTYFHQRFYHANNITLVTANADIEKISNLIALLPEQQNQSKQVNVDLDNKKSQHKQSEDDGHNQKKYSEAINKLIDVYHLWLQDLYNQKVYVYKEIKSAAKTSITNEDFLPADLKSDLIQPLCTLSDRLTKRAINDSVIKISVEKPLNESLLPSLFTNLFKQARQQLIKSELNRQVYVSDQRNTIWLVNIGVTEHILANVSSYIISAYPEFLASRCHGYCYATQALTIKNSAYLVIFSAFDINVDSRLKDVLLCLLRLSRDKHFIELSLTLAKIKYCKAYGVSNNKVINITSTDICNYIHNLANKTLSP